MAEVTATPKKNVYISLHEAFVREGIQYTDKKDGRAEVVQRRPPASRTPSSTAGMSAATSSARST